jgi:dCTP deaminase
MILSDREIRLALVRRQLSITPLPGEEAWASTAVDLRLDGEILVWTPPVADPSTGYDPKFCPGVSGFSIIETVRKFTKPFDLRSAPYVLGRFDFILGWTREKLKLPHESRVCARVEGKSSLARLGLGIHVTAPTIHAGFGSGDDPEGDPLQLEIWNVGPLAVELRFEMRICQLIFEEVHGTPEKGYRGQFLDQGPKPS